MKNRDIEGPLEGLLDFKALGCANILKVDTPEGRRDQLTGADHVLGVHAIDLDVEDVDIRKTLEENAFALHDGLARHGTDIPKPKDGGSVAHHGHQVALCRISIRRARIALDLEARGRYPGRIGEGQVLGRDRRLAGNDLDLPGSTVAVVGEGPLLQTHL